MAEFEYIMSQARRMCDMHQECVDCPLVGRCFTPSTRNAKEVEQIITNWAKEHPEPVYPSWEEGWKQLFPEATTTVCPLMCPTGSAMDEYRRKCAGRRCDECKGTQMDAEVAEKLGIKPIGGK